MIFVDPLFVWPLAPAAGVERYFGNGKSSCHLFCFGEPVEALMRFATGPLKLKADWYQSPPSASLPHFDLTPAKRALAVKRGAVDLTEEEDAELTRVARILRKLAALLALATSNGATREQVPTWTICAWCGYAAGQHAHDLATRHGVGRILCDGRRIMPPPRKKT